MKENLHLIRERFPHYTKQEKDTQVRHFYNFSDELSETHYERMVAIIFEALDQKKYFPILRVCHGEFTLCVGRAVPKGLRRKINFFIKTILRNTGLMAKISYNGKKNDGFSREKLEGKDFKKIRRIWTSAAQSISKKGLIAPAFNDRHTYLEYTDKMMKFFRENKITFNAENYFTFFGVYAFLAGPDFEKAVKGRNIVAVTWLDEMRRSGLEKAFRSMGAANVDFIEVSPHTAVLETIDPSQLPHAPDIALFGCGLGSAPLIDQFKNQKTVCIDAGFILDMFANQSLRGKRVWTFPDNLYGALSK
ncbi:MAG TPA: hypothetical protein DCX06_10200 [Opitutae bacterium]|nr:hypothetical protein [Opitutae bacterium]